MANTHQIAVIGAGLMGHGIALTMARASHLVIISDPIEDVVNSVMKRISESLTTMGVGSEEIEQALSNISTTTSLADAVKDADCVIEAVPEKLDLKREIFKQIEAHTSPDTILASNTSVIQITKIMSGLTHPERALGTHWWNPPHIIPLVEIVKTEWTKPDIAQAMFDLLEEVGKTPVVVERDVPGFIGNRLQHALWREAISLVENGICDAEAVDTVIKSSFGRRLAVLGPLENADLVGTDLTLDIHENVLFDLEDQDAPSSYLKALVNDGKLGMKSGEGFQKWSEKEISDVRERVAEHLIKLETILPN